MVLKNLTKKTILTTDLKEAESLVDQIFGLLKQSNPRSLLFRTRFGIHTFGLKDSIDVLVLDKTQKVVKLAQVSPGSLFFWKPLYNLVIELPKGVLKKSKTKTGDILNFN